MSTKRLILEGAMLLAIPYTIAAVLATINNDQTFLVAGVLLLSGFFLDRLALIALHGGTKV